jgi:hypothetical protein
VVGVVGEQRKRDRFGPEPGEQGQQVERLRFVVGEAVECHRPRRRHRPWVQAGRIVVEDTFGSLGHQPQVLRHT